MSTQLTGSSRIDAIADDGPTVLCVGQTNVDHVFSIDGALRAGEKYVAVDASVRVGGGAANAAIAVARLGGRAVLASRLGEDAAARHALAELRAFGVDVTSVEQLGAVATAVSAVVVDGSGGRTIVAHADQELYLGRPPELPAFDAVVTDARWGSATMAALRRARDRCVPAVVDIDERVPAGRLAGIDELASHIVYSRRGILHHHGADDGTGDVIEALHRAQRRTDAFVAVTSGELGVLWLDRGALRHRRAVDVVAVDTTGAGDVFHGAFALALAGGDTEPAAIDVAVAAAGLACSRPTGPGRIPRRAEVDELLARGDRRVPA